MHAVDWLLALQWTALFAAQALAVLGTGVHFASGAAIAAGWLAIPGKRATADKTAPSLGIRLLGWGIRFVAGGLAAAMVVAYVATPLTGDGILAAQLRTAILDSALALLAGAGLSGAGTWAWSLSTRPRSAPVGPR